MNTSGIADTLAILFSELVNGAPEKGTYVLNPRDAGLLGSLDRLSAQAASASSEGGATIAAHAEHLRYGLSLMNRWAAGEPNPFATADWTAAWKTTSVSDEEWSRLRADLRDQAHCWLRALGTPRDVHPMELNGVVSSIAHLAYHLGAIRQNDRTTRGPTASD